MRGKLSIVRRRKQFAGITPADAGKTHPDKQRLNLIEDHPRGCGENECPLLKSRGQLGSPPRMRGKLEIYVLRKTHCRITPADAGKTLSLRLTPSAFQDHPRGCGENRHFDAGFAVKIGSPPRMRGKLSFPFSMRRFSRITPADAGKTHTFAGWKALG